MIKINNSERLSYWLMSDADYQELYELNQDPAVMHFINGGKPTSMQDIKEKMLPRMAAFRNAEKGWGIWGARITATNEFIGWVLVRPMDFFNENPQLHNLELGWRFMQKTWGKGYGTEAAQQIMNAIVEQTNISHVCAIAEPENTASINIMQKLGMSYKKTYLHKDPLGDTDVVYYEKAV